jgi:DNA (cytosine-5)-methyltransferase 1
MPINSKEQPYISLFSGAGGLDLGLELAGWRTSYASDNDPFAIATLKLNAGLDIGGGKRAFEGTFIECADIRSLDAASILAKSGLSKGGVPLLAGGPPCQSWSSAGHQLGFNDPRGRLFDDFVRIANNLDVRWLLLENVRGLLTARGPDGSPGSALNQIRRNLWNAGFQTTVALLNAADFGVPQRRVRLFMIGFRAGDAPPFPQPTHSKSLQIDRLPWVPLSRALECVGELDLAEIIRPTGKLAIDLATIPPGSGVKSPGKSEKTRPGGHWGYKQGAFVADLNLPARTITANTQQDWVRDAVHGLRRICPREGAVIQSFPQSWKFEGTSAIQYRLIGNAVPPCLGIAIGASMLEHAALGTEKSLDFDDLLPLPESLARHVRYTVREEASNGQSRREGTNRRVPKVAGTYANN